MGLGEKIRHERERLGLTQKAVATSADVSTQSVSRWERDEAEPQLSQAVKLAHALGRSLAWLVDQPEEEQSGLRIPSGLREYIEKLAVIYEARLTAEHKNRWPGLAENIQTFYDAVTRIPSVAEERDQKRRGVLRDRKAG